MIFKKQIMNDKQQAGGFLFVCFGSPRNQENATCTVMFNSVIFKSSKKKKKKKEESDSGSTFNPGTQKAEALGFLSQRSTRPTE